MSKQIITISREFGSGGREIGVCLAKKFGIPVYDKEDDWRMIWGFLIMIKSF